MEIDLFGEKIKKVESKTEIYIRKKNEIEFTEKVVRFEYLQKLNSDEMGLFGNMELVLLYGELQEVFINGHFLSVIMLGQAWIEKNLHIHLEKLGLNNVTKKSSAFMIKYCLDNKIINDYLIKKMDRFRLIRNPIAHIKSMNHIHNLDQRSTENRKNPFKQLEDDAKEIIEISLYIAKNGLH